MPRRLLPVLLLVGLLAVLVPPDRAAATTSPYGATAAPDRVLRAGCHPYAYRYSVRRPGDGWVLETFLLGPGGDRLGSGSFMSEYDPVRGRGSFRVCRYSTRPGLFRIRAKLSYYVGDQQHVAWFQPSTFRLRRA